VASNVDMPNLVVYFNWTPIFELYVIRCDSKYIYQKDMCSKEIDQCV
jgi:hypothetical protein